ncbi:MAG: adenosylcobinamide-GDP ribazoletransferase [Desulfobulbaceae bacterium]|nr:adenosylcobinamide-GDP ribazoletransferase [Desulfobulbaceae bacterium]
MMNWVASLLTAFRFLTVIPLPGAQESGEENFSRSLLFFPLVGSVLGLLSAATAWLLQDVVGPLPLAVVLVGLLAGLSGALHLDGLADTADGFFSSRPRERILEIMRDSRIGAMGVIGLVLVLLLKISSLASLEPAMARRAVFLMPLAGRCVILIMMALLPYARSEGGLGSLFYGSSVRFKALAGLFFLVAAAWLVGSVGGLVAVAAGLLVAVLFCFYCRKKIGGATGDTLGAVCELTEAAVAFGYCLSFGR